MAKKVEIKKVIRSNDITTFLKLPLRSIPWAPNSLRSNKNIGGKSSKINRAEINCARILKASSKINQEDKNILSLLLLVDLLGREAKKSLSAMNIIKSEEIKSNVKQAFSRQEYPPKILLNKNGHNPTGKDKINSRMFFL